MAHEPARDSTLQRIARAMEHANDLTIEIQRNARSNQYPYDDGDTIDLGSLAQNDGSSIRWNGNTYYRPCDQFVRKGDGGLEHRCVKRQNHRNLCEDWDGRTNDNSIPQP